MKPLSTSISSPHVTSRRARWAGAALAIVAGVALTACADMRGGRSGSSGSSGTSGASGSSGSGYEGSGHRDDRGGGYAGAMDNAQGPSGSSGMAGSTGGAGMSMSGVVAGIELMTRQQSGIGVSGAPGAAAVGGTVAGMASDRVYRVTLRTDDGSMRSVVVETAPDYRVGDRVTYGNGSIQRQ